MAEPTQFVWTRAAVKRELQHLCCCIPGSPPCSLRRQVETVPGRRSDERWAAFQLSAHQRGDLLVALTELFDVPADLDWANLTDAQVRELPRLVAALWVTVVRGPDDRSRPQVPPHQKPVSRFGFLTWKAASRVLRAHRRRIQDDIAEAIGMIVGWLSPWQDEGEPAMAKDRLQCTPKVHVFAVGGQAPADESPCFCHRYSWLEWQVERAARALE